MANDVKYKPDGYHNVTPYLTVQGADKVLDFVKAVFDGTIIECMKRPDGTVGHAEVRIGDSIIMLGEAAGDGKTMPASLYVYVEDVDATYKRAVAAGATS